MLLTYDFLKAPKPDSKFLDSFSTLSNDRYIKHKYCFRKRAFAKGIVDNNLNIQESDDTEFCQDERINKYLGGIKRIYPKATTHCINYAISLLSANSNMCRAIVFKGINKIGIHQIRITAQDTNEGYPVPEGHHQDGVEFVIIVPIQSYNIVGGIHSIRHGSQDGPEILDRPVSPSEALILNDRHVFHYASPVFAKYSALEGYRDSIVITLSF